MRFWTQGRVVSALGRISFLCLLLCAVTYELAGSTPQPDRIICRDDLSSGKREDLAAKLRVITGWPDLKFDDRGVLRFDSHTTHHGSQTARDLLQQAQSGPNVIIIEDASDRHDVVFSRVLPARWKHHRANTPPAFVVLIDFADFDRLMGDRTALRSFDVAWALMHELDHVVNDSQDSVDLAGVGECEDRINAMRLELSLPIRTSYFFTYFREAPESGFKTKFVRLAFEQTDATAAKQHRYWVMWDATLVGGLEKQIAARR